MPLSSFNVNEKSCVRCGLCISDCVCAIIKMSDFPFIERENLAKCILCGHCQAICPTQSISLDGNNPKSLANSSKPVSAEIIAEIIGNRRSVRQYAKQPPEVDRIHKAIEIAALAPTAKNIRDIGFVIFNGREKVEKLMLACADVMEKHGILLEVAAQIRKNNDVLFRGAPCVLAIYASERPFAVTDCATTLGALELALPSFGLASCWSGYFTATCGKELPAGLTLPDNRHMYGGLMIGHPLVKYDKIPERPIPEIHWA